MQQGNRGLKKCVIKGKTDVSHICSKLCPHTSTVLQKGRAITEAETPSAHFSKKGGENRKLTVHLVNLRIAHHSLL